MDLTATVYRPPRARRPWRVEDLLENSSVRYYGYGRHALAGALQLVGAQGGTVLLPSFICRDLLAAVAAVGATPVYYNVGADLRPLEDPARWPDAKAILAVDYFGWPQDLPPFEAYARRCGAVIIEDAAHALFSRDASGRPLGTRAPLGILSLRKSLPLPNGGALVASDRALALKLPAPLNGNKTPDSRLALKSLARPLLALAGARAAHRALTAWRGTHGDASGHVEGAADSETQLPIPREPCLELGRPLVCADPAIEASRRRALWSLCDGLARKSGLAPVFDSLPEGVVPYGYAFRTDNLSSSRRVFSALGLTTLPWPDLPSAARAAAAPTDRNVALVHFLW